jgi:hypothetical protein
MLNLADPILVVNKYAVPGMPELLTTHELVYIGRDRYGLGKYGNPFRVGPDHARGEAVEAYRKFAEESDLHYPEILQKLKEGKKVALVCYCAPKACHGDVIKARLLKDLEE